MVEKRKARILRLGVKGKSKPPSGVKRDIGDHKRLVV